MKASRTLVRALCGLASVSSAAARLISPRTNNTQQDEYEYVIVGSGAGGGPLASRLALAGHSVMLIESGDDQGTNPNYTVPGFQGLVASDPKIGWDIYVNHYEDQTRAQRDPKYTWLTPSGDYHVQLTDGPPPEGSKELGILYPRAGTLGGCTSHNALIWITPDASDWDGVAAKTGDQSWSASNMTQYLNKVYEWLKVGPTDPTILLHDTQLVQQLAGGADVMGVGPEPLSTVEGFGSALLLDPNTAPNRDTASNFYNIPLIQSGGARDSVRDFVIRTIQGGAPLTLALNRHVTKINFETPTNGTGKPKAVSVDYLDGAHLYGASPLSGGNGTPGNVKATKEIIIAGGTYNTVQLLKLSGIGPKEELAKFNIPVVTESKGLGTNMMDRYEIPVNVNHTKDFALLNGCTFDGKPHDQCYKQWQDNVEVLAARGAYASNGLAAAMVTRSNYATNEDVDLFIFGGPVDFVGYFYKWGDYAVRTHNHFSWYTLKAHSNNRAGTVTLRSTNPLEQPQIDFRYFDTGTTTNGVDVDDVMALVQAMNISREALSKYNDFAVFGGSPFVEQNPGKDVQSTEQLAQYAKDVAWGHHACCTAALGQQQDEMSVLDSNFKVFGVDGLRVVDASVFPTIPGTFIQASIYMVAEKAADVILKGT